MIVAAVVPSYSTHCRAQNRGDRGRFEATGEGRLAGADRRSLSFCEDVLPGVAGEMLPVEMEAQHAGGVWMTGLSAAGRAGERALDGSGLLCSTWLGLLAEASPLAQSCEILGTAKM